jgi:hypothetical protein
MIGLFTLLTVAQLHTDSIPARSTRSAADSAGSTFVTIQNDRAVPLTIYAETRLGETKLGIVAPNSTATLRVRDVIAAQGEIDILVDPRGENDEETGYLPIEVGATLRIDVPERWGPTRTAP